jgi:hypothetical protein
MSTNHSLLPFEQRCDAAARRASKFAPTHVRAPSCAARMPLSVLTTCMQRMFLARQYVVGHHCALFVSRARTVIR